MRLSAAMAHVGAEIVLKQGFEELAVQTQDKKGGVWKTKPNIISVVKMTDGTAN